MFDYVHWRRVTAGNLLHSPPIHTGEWQSIDTSASKVHATYELQDVMLTLPIPTSDVQLAAIVQPNLPWADLHFAERVGGEPVNPPPSHTQWPWARHNAQHQEGEQQKFSHSYPERFWPKWANDGYYPHNHTVPQLGIRFPYGDLEDVVNLLVDHPMTRQAYLPIWFPEDTGATQRQRVPCTLGYHFMMRNGQLSCRYFMRSCDFIRHMNDDVYLAARLTQWVCDKVSHRTYDKGSRIVDGQTLEPLGFEIITPGSLTMFISSLHAFVGDKYALTKEANA